MIVVDVNRLKANQEAVRSRRIPLASKQRCRTGGKRGQRREENTRELTKIYEEMREAEDQDFVRFIEPQESKFSKVLEDPELRKTWQVFTSLPGDAQDRFINYIDRSMDQKIQEKQTRTAESVSVQKIRNTDDLDESG